MNFMKMIRSWLIAIPLLFALTSLAEDLTHLSLEELVDLKITSVSKTERRLSELGAAAYVIRNEDLRRSGATSIPESLRYVPGLQVARLDANKWAVSSRGFNGRFTNKLLVLIDGRSVYTPLFSGVFWESQDVLFEDVEQIEVIRGPGGSVWGANAVNGVINIITKKASKTQGTFVSAGYGSEEQGFGEFRFGDKAGKNGYYRLYAKYFNRDEGFHGHDDWRSGQGGFRSDFELYEGSDLTVQGDYYDSQIGHRTTTPILTSPFSLTFDEDISSIGGNLLSRWTHSLENGSRLQLQGYYDRRERNSFILEEIRDSLDVDFQYEFNVGENQKWTCGFEHSLTSDETRGSFELSLNPRTRTTQLLSTFAQNEITVIDDKLWVTVGSKFDHNEYTGYEAQPSLKTVWKPSPNHTLWTSVSRAVRTPSRVEHDARITDSVTPGPTAVTLFGDRHRESEELLALELGHRMIPISWFSTDLSVFFNQYEHLLTLERGAAYTETTPSPTHLVVPLFVSSKMSGETYGLELSAQCEAASWLKLSGSYTFLQMQLHRSADSNDMTSENDEGRNPRHQINLRAQCNISKEIEWDTGVRFVDSLPAISISSYVTLDTRIAYRPTRRIEISLVGQHLLDSPHPEFAPNFIDTQATQVEYSIYGKVSCRF
jgi:iron complex outermembrane recepter protein